MFFNMVTSSACLVSHFQILSSLCYLAIPGSEAARIKDEAEINNESSKVERKSLTCSSSLDYRDHHFNISTITCKRNQICKKNFTIANIDTVPYSNEMEVQELLIQCCGLCVSFSRTPSIFKTVKDWRKNTLQQFDFVYPVLASERTKKLYGYHYAPFMDVPKAMYIVKKVDKSLLLSTVKLYPYILAFLMLAVIVGFISWVIEHRFNDSFPSSFTGGVFAGFWWAFVTMTTVGYGDVTMNSKPGKVFGVLWMLFGAISFSLLTGSLTTLILNLHAPQNMDMMNQKVGVLKDRTFDTFVASQGGGVVHYNDKIEDFHVDFFELIMKLKEGHIDGVMMDSYTLKYVTHCMAPEITHNESHCQSSTVKWEQIRGFFLHHTLKGQKTYEGQKLTYGMLIKDVDDFEYFKDTIAESRLEIELTWDYDMNQVEKMRYVLRGPHEHSSFHRILVGIGCVLIFVVMLGALYDLKGRKDGINMRECHKDEYFAKGGQSQRRINSYLV